MPGLSKVIVLDPDARASRQVQLGFEREGIPAAGIPAEAPRLEPPEEDTGLVVVGGVDGQGTELVRRARGWLDDHGVDAPIVFAGRGVAKDDAIAAGADEAVRQPAYLRDVVTIGRLLRGRPAGHRHHIVGNLIEITGVFTLVRALAALERSATLTLIRGLRRGEVRFYLGEVTSAHVGMIHGQAALHQLLLWTDARFDFHHEDVVRRHQIPLSHEELFADAERFLAGVRDSSGGLSPAMVLEQDASRVQSFAKQIPTEVYGVLRMFDGHHTLTDVLEDSAYRVFETLRVAQRAVEAGLLRVVEHQPRRPSWRTILAVEDWLVGAEPRDIAVDSGPIATPSEPVRASGRTATTAARQVQGKSSRKRRKKKRSDTPPAVAVDDAAPREIDWGALIPRIVGAEVGPLAGVIPASHVSGEIVTAARSPGHSSTPPSGTRRSEPAAALGDEPTVVFDEAAERAEADRIAAARLAVEQAVTERISIGQLVAEADRAEADRAEAKRAVEQADTDRVTLAQIAAEAARVEAEQIAAEAEQAQAARTATDAERVEGEQLAAETEQAEAARTATDAERAEAEQLTAETEQAQAARTATDAERAEAEQLTAEAEQAQAAQTATDAERAEAEQLAAEHTAATAEPAPAERATAEDLAATASGSTEPGHVIDDLALDDTKRERGLFAAPRIALPTAELTAVELVTAVPPAALTAVELVTGAEPVIDAVPALLAPAAVVQDGELIDTSDAITARYTAPPVAHAGEPAAKATPAAAAARAPVPAPDSAPTAVADEVSDGVVLHHIATAETAPVKRRSPSEPLDNDRPGDATGEITMPRAAPTIEVRRSEPTILVDDLAAVHAAVSAVAQEQAAAPATPDATSPSLEAPVLDARSGAAAFSDAEEEFFRAGHELHEKQVEAAAPPPVESFDDLDEDYRPVGFWERLRGKPVPPGGSPEDPDKK